MIRRIAPATALVVALFGSARVARADPCAAAGRLSTGPVQVTVQEGHHGLARSPCPRTEVGVGGGGLLLIDTANFFGRIRANAEIWGSLALWGNTELFGLIEVYRYENVISSLAMTSSGVGHTTIGATRRLYTVVLGGELTLGATGRVVLPTADVYVNAWPFYVDIGATAEYRLSDLIAIHAQLGFLYSAAVSRGPRDTRVGVALTAGAGLQPTHWFALIADLSAGFGATDALDHVSAGAETRFAVTDRLGISLAATFPLAGHERALTAAALRLTWQAEP